MKARDRKREKIISVLLETGGNIKEAAAMLEMGETTLWRHLQDPEFRRQYGEARARLLDLAIAMIQRASSEAVETLRVIMNSATEPPGPRVSAAKGILDLAIKGQEVENLKSRIEALERKVH